VAKKQIEQVPTELQALLDESEVGELDSLRAFKAVSANFERTWPAQAARLRELEGRR